MYSLKEIALYNWPKKLVEQRLELGGAWSSSRGKLGRGFYNLFVRDLVYEAIILKIGNSCWDRRQVNGKDRILSSPLCMKRTQNGIHNFLFIISQFTIMFFDVDDSVPSLIMDGRLMKKSSVLVTILQPSNYEFLPRHPSAI